MIERRERIVRLDSSVRVGSFRAPQAARPPARGYRFLSMDNENPPPPFTGVTLSRALHARDTFRAAPGRKSSGGLVRCGDCTLVKADGRRWCHDSVINICDVAGQSPLPHSGNDPAQKFSISQILAAGSCASYRSLVCTALSLCARKDSIASYSANPRWSYCCAVVRFICSVCCQPSPAWISVNGV
jgi:hypothetical protein